jgi:uncharacterized membrane protein
MPLAEPPKYKRTEPKNPNQIHKDSLSLNEKIALKATKAFGSMPMFYLFFVWALLPLIPFLNQFQAAILYVSAGIIQLIALPLITVGQNLQSRHAEVRAEEEYKTTNTTYHDTEYIMRRLDAQDEELLKQSKMIEQLLNRK